MGRKLGGVNKPRNLDESIDLVSDEPVVNPNDAGLEADLLYLKYGIEGKSELTQKGKLPGKVADDDPQSYFTNMGMDRNNDSN